MSRGPFDGDPNHYDGKGVLGAVETVGSVLAEVMVGKDLGRQADIDAAMVKETSLPPNVVAAASIAYCKAAAKQAFATVSDHIAVMSDNPETRAPTPAFSIINSGRMEGSLLWIQVRYKHPTTRCNLIRFQEYPGLSVWSHDNPRISGPFMSDWVRDFRYS